jgi:hypothetical protein
MRAPGWATRTVRSEGCSTSVTGSGVVLLGSIVTRSVQRAKPERSTITLYSPGNTCWVHDGAAVQNIPSVFESR